MRAAVALPLLLYCAPSNALTVHELQQQCEAEPAYCLGYLQGVLDSRNTWRHAYESDPAHPTKNKFHSMTKDTPLHRADIEDPESSTGKLPQSRDLPWVPKRYCIPPHETVVQLKEIVFRHLAGHPTEFDDPADVAVAAALGAAFPCPK